MTGGRLLEDAFMRLGSIGKTGAEFAARARSGERYLTGALSGDMINDAVHSRRKLISMGRKRAMIGGGALGAGTMVRRSSGTRGLQGRSSGGMM